MISLGKLKSLEEWRTIREEIRSAFGAALGVLPKEHVELQVKTVDEMDFGSYTRRRINYFVDEWERVSAWLFIPEGKDEAPAMICCHQMTALGKDEPAGLEGESTLNFAQHFAELGYITLAPDSITAGDRVPNGLDPLDTRGFYKDNPKTAAAGKMLWDHMHAVDVLCDMKRVDSARIGVVGQGMMGGLNALLLSAYDERVQACITVGGLTRFAADKNVERWCGGMPFVFFPALRGSDAKKKTFPFDIEHILALIAPTPTLLIAPGIGPNADYAKGCEKAVDAARGVYGLLGAPDAVDHFAYGEAPVYVPELTAMMPEFTFAPVESLDAIEDWFARWL